MAGWFLVGYLLAGGSSHSVSTISSIPKEIDGIWRVVSLLSNGSEQISNHSFATKQEAEQWCEDMQADLKRRLRMANGGSICGSFGY